VKFEITRLITTIRKKWGLFRKSNTPDRMYLMRFANSELAAFVTGDWDRITI